VPGTSLHAAQSGSPIGLATKIYRALADLATRREPTHCSRRRASLYRACAGAAPPSPHLCRNSGLTVEIEADAVGAGEVGRRRARIPQPDHVVDVFRLLRRLLTGPPGFGSPSRRPAPGSRRFCRQRYQEPRVHAVSLFRSHHRSPALLSLARPSPSPLADAPPLGSGASSPAASLPAASTPAASAPAASMRWPQSHSGRPVSSRPPRLASSFSEDRH
jgi:hypothetical protein